MSQISTIFSPETDNFIQQEISDQSLITSVLSMTSFDNSAAHNTNPLNIISYVNDIPTNNEINEKIYFDAEMIKISAQPKFSTSTQNIMNKMPNTNYNTQYNPKCSLSGIGFNNTPMPGLTFEPLEPCKENQYIQKLNMLLTHRLTMYPFKFYITPHLKEMIKIKCLSDQHLSMSETNHANLIIKIVPIFLDLNDINKPVLACKTHVDEINDPSKPEYRNCKTGFEQRFILSNLPNIQYGTQGDRYILTLPLSHTEIIDAEHLTIPLEFVCFTSCVGGINRRIVELIFTLENPLTGSIFARSCVRIRVCCDIKRDAQKLLQPKKGKKAAIFETLIQQSYPVLTESIATSCNSPCTQLSSNLMHNAAITLKPNKNIHNIDSSVVVPFNKNVEVKRSNTNNNSCTNIPTSQTLHQRKKLRLTSAKNVSQTQNDSIVLPSRDRDEKTRFSVIKGYNPLLFTTDAALHKTCQENSQNTMMTYNNMTNNAHNPLSTNYYTNRNNGNGMYNSFHNLATDLYGGDVMERHQRFSDESSYTLTGSLSSIYTNKNMASVSPHSVMQYENFKDFPTSECNTNQYDTINENRYFYQNNYNMQNYTGCKPYQSHINNEYLHSNELPLDNQSPGYLLNVKNQDQLSLLKMFQSSLEASHNIINAHDYSSEPNIFSQNMSQNINSQYYRNDDISEDIIRQAIKSYNRLAPILSLKPIKHKNDLPPAVFQKFVDAIILSYRDFKGLFKEHNKSLPLSLSSQNLSQDTAQQTLDNFNNLFSNGLSSNSYLVCRYRLRHIITRQTGDETS